MNSIIAVLIVGLASVPFVSLAAEPFWDCPNGQEPIQYLEQPGSNRECGVPTSACLRTGAPSPYYHYLCPARSHKLPYQCADTSFVYRIMPSDDSPLLECGSLLQSCVALDPPRNSLYDCRQSTSPVLSVQPPTPKIPVPVISPLDDGLDPQPTLIGFPTITPSVLPFDIQPRRTFWQRVFDLLFGWLQ